MPFAPYLLKKRGRDSRISSAAIHKIFQRKKFIALLLKPFLKIHLMALLQRFFILLLEALRWLSYIRLSIRLTQWLAIEMTGIKTLAGFLPKWMMWQILFLQGLQLF